MCNSRCATNRGWAQTALVILEIWVVTILFKFEAGKATANYGLRYDFNVIFARLVCSKWMGEIRAQHWA